MTYVYFSLPFLILALVLWIVRRNAYKAQVATTLAVGAVVLVLTAIFDNLMIWAGLVGYGDAQRLGLQLGLVPVEDFFYSIFVVLVVPAVWSGIDHVRNKKAQAHNPDREK